MASVQQNPTIQILTPEGRGAVALLEVRGPADRIAAFLDNHFAAANKKPFADQQFGHVLFGYWTCRPATAVAGQVALNDIPNSHDITPEAVLPAERQTSIEEIVVCRVSADLVEINCHGGYAAVERIMHSAMNAAIDVQSPHLASPFNPHGAPISITAEYEHVLTRTTTRRCVEVVLAQSPSLLANRIKQVCRELDEKDADSYQIAGNLSAILEWSEFGIHLTKPWTVALVGRPNVGKSTLINALLGFDRAIVVDQPGTTRDLVVGETAIDGWPIKITDTAGIRSTSNPLESAGITKAHQAMHDADLVCVLVDQSQPLTSDDIELLRRALSERLDRVLLVRNKADLTSRCESLPAEFQVESIAISAVTGSGLEELAKKISRSLVPQVPSSDQPIPLTNRQVQMLDSALHMVRASQFKAAQARLVEVLSPIHDH